MRVVLILLLLITSSAVSAQESEQLPSEYQEKLSGIKNEKKRLKKYRKYLKKDSVRRNKVLQNVKAKGKQTALNEGSKLNEHLPAAIEQDSSIAKDVSGKAIEVLNDSLRQSGIEVPQIDSTAFDTAKEKVKGLANQKVKDELGMDVPDITLDSTMVDQGKSELRGQLDELGQEELGVGLTDVQLDSAGRAKLANDLEKRAEQELKNVDGFDQLGDKAELGKLDEYKGQLEQTRQQMQQNLARQQMKEKMASQAKEYISKNADKLQQVQSKMGELKKKYSYVPNSNDLSTAKKRTSLEDEPLGKRLVLGGNFNVTETSPVSIDLAPVIGYKINTLFEVGITGLYRAQFNADRNGINAEDENTYGYSVFVNHMVFKNFFGYLEGENISRVKTLQDKTKREWDQTLLLGIGRKFNIAKWLEMQAIITYNFLHENQDGVYNSPIVFKTGVRVKR